MPSVTFGGEDPFLAIRFDPLIVVGSFSDSCRKVAYGPTVTGWSGHRNSNPEQPAKKVSMIRDKYLGH